MVTLFQPKELIDSIIMSNDQLSIASSYSTADPAALQAKYIKLTSEFSKLKAQTLVLKHAIQQERASNETLKETNEHYEKRLRKATEDIDLLQFHNGRLSKRLEKLQIEFKEEKAAYGWFGLGKASAVHSLKEELSTTQHNLEIKIEENENLQIRMQEMVASHAKREVEVKNEILQLQTLCNTLQKENESIIQGKDETLRLSKKECSRLGIELAKVKDELEKIHDNYEQKMAQLNENEEHLSIWQKHYEEEKKVTEKLKEDNSIQADTIEKLKKELKLRNSDLLAKESEVQKMTQKLDFVMKKKEMRCSVSCQTHQHEHRKDQSTITEESGNLEMILGITLDGRSGNEIEDDFQKAMIRKMEQQHDKMIAKMTNKLEESESRYFELERKMQELLHQK